MQIVLECICLLDAIALVDKGEELWSYLFFFYLTCHSCVSSMRLPWEGWANFSGCESCPSHIFLLLGCNLSPPTLQHSVNFAVSCFIINDIPKRTNKSPGWWAKGTAASIEYSHHKASTIPLCLPRRCSNFNIHFGQPRDIDREAQ